MRRETTSTSAVTPSDPTVAAHTDIHDVTTPIPPTTSTINIATASFDAVVNATKKTIDENGNYFALSKNMAEYVYENVKKNIQIFNMENLK